MGGERVTAGPGRPSLYSEELAETICERLENGESLRTICRDDEMPDRTTVNRWRRANEVFTAKCACARDYQAELMDDEILDTARACTPETAAADRVKISAYQWRAAKLQPKKYGDKVTTEMTGADGGPIKTEDVTMLEAARRVAFVLATAAREQDNKLIE